MKPITENTLFYGDNLFILREYIDAESVDLIYLDPPFNSSRSYNVLFKDEHGTDSEARKERREKGSDLSLHNTGGDFLPARLWLRSPASCAHVCRKEGKVSKQLYLKMFVCCIR